MAVNRKRLVFFERWFAPIAEEILSIQEDIELVRLHYTGGAEENWSALSTACGLSGQCPHRADAALVRRRRTAGALPAHAGAVFHRRRL